MNGEAPTIFILDRDIRPGGTLFSELEALGYMGADAEDE